ncbi:MAG: NAD-dependent malic enzyme, partial [Deltaproteobacteria bacterium]|nr:NAD-dependent malic enzyme [Deltaproteobacteria bacterium]
MTGYLPKVLYDGEIDLAYIKSSSKLSRTIADDPSLVSSLTSRFNRVAIISDGSGVPGLGDVGPLPSLPFVEKKAIIYQKLAGIEAVPIVLESRSLDEILRVITVLAPSFGAINLEAISENRCLQIKNRLLLDSDLPVFQDNLDGIPIVCLAALRNALKLVQKNIEEVKIVLSGSEGESMPMVEFLTAAGFQDIIVCDRNGTIHKGRHGPTNWVKEKIAQQTNPRQVKGGPAKALIGA